jgi:hypothetical protein
LTCRTLYINERSSKIRVTSRTSWETAAGNIAEEVING